MHEAATVGRRRMSIRYSGGGRGADRRSGPAWPLVAFRAGAGLYVSVVLRLPLPPDSLPVVTLALGLAVAETITRVTDLTSRLTLAQRHHARRKEDRRYSGATCRFGGHRRHRRKREPSGFPAGDCGRGHLVCASPPAACTRAKTCSIGLLPTIDSFCRMLVEGGRQADSGSVYPPFELRARQACDVSTQPGGESLQAPRRVWTPPDS